MTHPADSEVERYTDHYFNRTKRVIGRFGDARVTYAIFMRRPVVFAPRLALQWLEELGHSRNTSVDLDLRYGEGKWVGAGEPMMYITGSFFHLVDLETIFLQKLGPACVAAYNAWTMCADMPKSAFLAMDARHCAGQEMAEMMAYAASVGGSEKTADHELRRADREVLHVEAAGMVELRAGLALLNDRFGVSDHGRGQYFLFALEPRGIGRAIHSIVIVEAHSHHVRLDLERKPALRDVPGLEHRRVQGGGQRAHEGLQVPPRVVVGQGSEVRFELGSGRSPQKSDQREREPRPETK
jgi:hypothetical protein